MAAEVTRNLSDEWKVKISISENFGYLTGPAQRMIRVEILDRTNYDDPQHRTVWYKSVGELERLRDALDYFIKLTKED